MFEFVKTGDVSKFKKKLEKYHPHSLAFINRSNVDQKVPDKEIDVPLIKTKVKVPLQHLNLITFACIYSKVLKGKSMIVNPVTKYFLEELQLNSFRDLQINFEGVTMENQSFLLVPMIEESHEVLTMLLKNHHLWSYQDFLNMLIYLK